MEGERLGGFCVLIKREVLDKIGAPNLDERTNLGLFDTDILNVKGAASRLHSGVLPGFVGAPFWHADVSHGATKNGKLLNDRSGSASHNEKQDPLA